MDKFGKELAQLPQNRQKAIREALQRQIIAQAEFVREEQPTKFLDYINGEIQNADESMLKMVQESSREGAEIYNISETYIWNKERKQTLVKLRDEYLQQKHQNKAPEQSTEPEQTAIEPQQIPQDFVTNEAKELFKRAIKKELVSNDGDKYKWNDSASLYGYFVDKTSDFLNIRHSNNRLPWKKYEAIITNHSSLIATARQAVNDYKNKPFNPPEGDDIVNDICR
jgi:hypothetical protein